MATAAAVIATAVIAAVIADNRVAFPAWLFR